MSTATAQFTLDEVIEQVEDNGAIALPFDEAPDSLKKAVTRLALARREIFVDFQGDKVVVHKQGVRLGPAGTIVRRFRVTQIVEADDESAVRQGNYATERLETIEVLTHDD